jgi:alkylation response protein AidB-like acyl-CoA dehydrogenase
MPAPPGLNEQTRALLDLTREIADAELRPAADAAEKSAAFPRQAFRMLGKAGLLGLPYPERLGGGEQPYEVYLQVIEELARAWLTVGLGVSVHTLACYPLAVAGTEAQQERWLPAALGGDLLGAYCLSEPQCGSDAAALRTSAAAAGDEYVIDGVKAWISHAGQADFYTLFARTSGDADGPERSGGISCLYVPADVAGVSAAPAEHKMGMRARPRRRCCSRRPGSGATTWWARKARVSRWRSPRWTPGGSASRPARPAWPGRRWRRR